jgi:hypothetical protein
MEPEGSMPNSQELSTCPLFWARPIQSTSPHPTSTRSTLILFTHLRLGLPSVLLPSEFPYFSLYLTLWSWVPLEKRLVVWILDSFPAIYGTRRFIAEFTRALHLPLSWARPIKSTSPNPTSTRSILILSNHLRLGLPGDLLPSGYPTNILYAFLLSPIRSTCPPISFFSP